jgi:hypothetical protein
MGISDDDGTFQIFERWLLWLSPSPYLSRFLSQRVSWLIIGFVYQDADEGIDVL